MIEENSNNQEGDKESRLQPQNARHAQANLPAQAEIIEFFKYTRCTALATDRLVGTLLQMTAKLEEEGILKRDRTSRLDRDKKLRSIKSKLQKSESEIDEMMKLIPNHPDADMMIKSLFKGIKTININIQNLDDSSNNSKNANNENLQQQNINNEIGNNQMQNIPNNFSTNEVPDVSQANKEADLQKSSEIIISEVKTEFN